MSDDKGVIINVYVESTHLRSNQNADPIKKLNRNPSSSHSRAFTTRGYDHRARLLAYARELRQNADADAAAQQHVEWPFKNSSPKPKKWRLSLPVEKIRQMFDGMKRKWEYGPIVTEDYNDGEGSWNQEIRMRKRKARASGERRRRRRQAPFCERVRCWLKEISMAWQICGNGGC